MGQMNWDYFVFYKIRIIKSRLPMLTIASSWVQPHISIANGVTIVSE